jgi:lipopolysaccharide transport system permease protein
VVLVDRDLKMLYKRSSIGPWWALAGPLMQLLVLTFVFQRVIPLNIPNYASYVFVGVLVWNWFSSSLIQSTSLITGSRALVRQPGFPLPLLPLVTVAVRLFHFAVAVPILLILLLMQDVRPSVAWLLAPVLLAIQFVLTTSLAYPLAALNVRMRDTQHVVGVVLQLTMFLTPIFYDPASLPAAVRGWYNLNPMVPLIAAWREVLLAGRTPDMQSLTLITVLSLGLLWAGRAIFVAESHRFVEEL